MTAYLFNHSSRKIEISSFFVDNFQSKYFTFLFLFVIVFEVTRKQKSKKGG